MKRTNICKGVVAASILMILCIPLMAMTSHAQGHAYHTNNHYGMAYLAEVEVRTREQNLSTAERVNAMAEIRIADEGRTNLADTEKNDADKEDASDEN